MPTTFTEIVNRKVRWLFFSGKRQPYRRYHRRNKARRKIRKPLITAVDSTTATRDYVLQVIRSSHNIKARLSDFRIDDYECSVSFSGPGYSADGFIERSTGTYELTVVSAGLFGVLNDIHKGSDTAALWTWIIDISAIVMVVVSLTGFIMIFFISRRKFPGLVVALTGAIIFAVLCCFCT